MKTQNKNNIFGLFGRKRRSSSVESFNNIYSSESIMDKLSQDFYTFKAQMEQNLIKLDNLANQFTHPSLKQDYKEAKALYLEALVFEHQFMHERFKALGHEFTSFYSALEGAHGKLSTLQKQGYQHRSFTQDAIAMKERIAICCYANVGLKLEKLPASFKRTQ